MSGVRCRLCSDAAIEGGDFCQEHQLASEMTPEPDENTLCGECGRDYDEEDGWVVRAAFSGNGLWARCPSCVAKWRDERRRAEALERGEEARALAEKEWRWLRTRWASLCLLCAEEISEDEKARHAPGLGVAHPGCVRKLGVEQRRSGGTIPLRAVG